MIGKMNQQKKLYKNKKENIKKKIKKNYENIQNETVANEEAMAKKKT